MGGIEFAPGFPISDLYILIYIIYFIKWNRFSNSKKNLLVSKIKNHDNFQAYENSNFYFM